MGFSGFRKGQSAIEYLMSYGWMLVVVAVVGAAIFSYIQGMGNIQSVSGLSNGDVQVEDLSIDGEAFKAELRATADDRIENLTIAIMDQEGNERVYSSRRVNIAPAGTNISKVPDATLSEDTKTHQIRIRYDMGNLENVVSEGTVTGRIKLNSTEEEEDEPSQDPANLRASYTMNASSELELGTFVEFNASESSPSEDIEAYEWDMDGDGQIERLSKTPIYEFSELGDRNINLTLIGKHGGRDSVAKEVNVVSGDQTVVSDELQERINNADPGDTLYVENGTYTGVTVPKKLNIYGEEGATIAGRSYIESSDVKIAGFTINDRLDVRGQNFDLKDSSVDSRSSGQWGVVVNDDDLDMKNVDINASKGAIALQSNTGTSDLDLVDARTESGGHPALRLQNNVNADVEGGSFKSGGGKGLYVDGSGSSISLSSEPTFTSSGWAFSVDRRTDIDLESNVYVGQGRGSVNMMSVAAENGDTIELGEGEVFNRGQNVSVNVPEPDSRDSYGYPIKNPTKTYYPTNLGGDGTVITSKADQNVELHYARLYGQNMEMRDVEIKPSSGNYGIETMADNITLENVTLDQPSSWAVVNRNKGLEIEDSHISGARGIHSNAVNGIEVRGSVIESNRHGLRPKGGTEDIVIENNSFSVDNNVVNAGGTGIDVRMEDNVIERSNNVVSASDSTVQMYNNTLNANYNALPSGSGLDVSLGTRNAVESGEFISAIVSKADPGDTVEVTEETAGILGEDVSVDIGTLEHVHGAAHFRTRDVEVSLEDGAPKFDVLRFHKQDIHLKGMDVETTRNKYAIETFSDDVVIEDIDLSNSNDWGIVNRADRLTVRDSKMESQKGFHMDGGTQGHNLINNTIITNSNPGLRPNGQITGVEISENRIESPNDGIPLKSGSGGNITRNVFDVSRTAVSVPDNNDISLGINKIERGIGGVVTSLDSVAEAGSTIKVNNTSAYIVGGDERFRFVDGAVDEPVGAIDLRTQDLLLNFTDAPRVNTGDRAIDLLGDGIKVDNAYLTGSHGIEFHGNDGLLINSTIDVNNWGVLTRSDSNTVRDSHINAQDAVHTNNNLNDIVVEDNIIRANRYGIRAKSGTTGQAIQNEIDAGTPLQTADMDTSGNKLGPIELDIGFSPASPETGQEVNFNSDIPEQFDMGEAVWQFGDGSISKEGEGVNEAYRLPGEYEVTLDVDTVHDLSYQNTNTIQVQETDINRFDGDETLIEDSESLQSVLDNANEGESFRLENGTYDSFSLSVNGIEIIAENGAEIQGESTINSNEVKLQNVDHIGRMNIKGTDITLNRSRFINDGGWGIVARTSGINVTETHIDSQKGIYMDNNVALDLDDSSIVADSTGVRVRSGAELDSSDNMIRGNNALDVQGTINMNDEVLISPGDIFGSISRSMDFENTIEINDGNILKPATAFADKGETVTFSDGEIDYSNGGKITTQTATYGGGDTNLYTEDATIRSDGTANLSGNRFYLKDQGMTLEGFNSDARIEPQGNDITIRDMYIKDDNSWGLVLRNSGANLENLTISGYRGIYVDNSLQNLEINDIDMDVDSRGLRLGDGVSNVNVSQSSLNSTSDYALRAKTVSDTELSGLVLAGSSAVTAQGNAELSFKGENTVKRGEILGGIDRASSPGDRVIVHDDKIVNEGSDFTVGWEPENHRQASIYTDELTLETENASIRALNIYGDQTLIQNANFTQESTGKRINVRANDVTFRDTSMKNINDWAIVQRNSGLDLENVTIEDGTYRGVYYDSGTTGHQVNDSWIKARGRGLYGQASTTLEVEDSTVKSPDRAIRKDNGGELSIENVVLESPDGKALSVHRNVQVDISDLDVDGGGDESLSAFLLASPKGTETVIDGSEITNDAAGFTIDTGTSDYRHLTINKNDNTVTLTNQTSISTLRINGNGNTVSGGKYFTDTNDHTFRVRGQDNTIRDTEIHNRYGWSFVIRRDGTTVENVDMRSKTGVYVDSNLNGNTVTDNKVNVSNNNGIYFKSGSDGLISNNLIINGDPAITPAEADTEDNTIE